MKNLILFLLPLLFLTSCKDPEEVTPQTPSQPVQGTSYMKATINGVSWEADSIDGELNYDNPNKPFFFYLTGADKKCTTCLNRELLIGFQNLNFPMTFTSGTQPGEQIPNLQEYTDSTGNYPQNGVTNITEKTDSYIKGTFSFNGNVQNNITGEFKIYYHKGGWFQ
jgi:hypothetical protein